MKRFVYENTGEQQADVICYAFSEDLINASEDELRDFLKVLSRHFPKTDNGNGGYRPMNNESLLNTFNNAYSNVCNLIEERRVNNRHRALFWVSFSTLVVLVATFVSNLHSGKV